VACLVFAQLIILIYYSCCHSSKQIPKELLRANHGVYAWQQVAQQGLASAEGTLPLVPPATVRTTDVTSGSVPNW